jgi:hypothetical protein
MLRNKAQKIQQKRAAQTSPAQNKRNKPANELNKTIFLLELKTKLRKPDKKSPITSPS